MEIYYVGYFILILDISNWIYIYIYNVLLFPVSLLKCCYTATILQRHGE